MLINKKNCFKDLFKHLLIIFVLDGISNESNLKSVLINVIFGGDSNQTISARNWELRRNGKFNIVSQYTISVDVY